MAAPLRRLVTALVLGALLLTGGCLINPLPTPDPNGGGAIADAAGRGDAGGFPGGQDALGAPDAGGGGATDAASLGDGAGPGVDVAAGDTVLADADDADDPDDADQAQPWPDTAEPGPLGDGADAQGDAPDG
jgi:hypothetical protein